MNHWKRDRDRTNHAGRQLGAVCRSNRSSELAVGPLTRPAAKAKDIDLVHRILNEERGIVIGSPPLEATTFQIENIRWTYVFYQSGLSINDLYTLDGPNPKRAVGFKLSEGMDIPAELGSFKFARQKSKLAGTIRGTYFVIKGEY